MTSTTNEAKNRPAASRITVTEDGTAGRSRDQRTSTSPIFGSRSRPLSSTLNRALAVNRTACRESFRDRNRGGATFGPFRFPVTEAKKFRYAAVQVGEGLLEHDRRHLAQPCPLRGLLRLGQPRRHRRVGDVRLPGLAGRLPRRARR